MRMSLIRLCIPLILSFSGHAKADDALNPKNGDFVVSNFRLSAGETLPELRIHYATIGTPRRDRSGHISNAVLLLHSTSLSGSMFLGPNIIGTNLAPDLFGAGQPLDASRYYLIVPDAIGHGRSTKPSDGLRAEFPHYGYDDSVQAEYRLVTEGLGIDHLRLILGTSMGGMQTWLWGERYPDLMDALMPIASQPVPIAGRNFLWRRLVTQAIRNDADWNGGNYAKQPTRWRAVLPVFEIMFSNVAHTQSTASTAVLSQGLFDRWTGLGKLFDANDVLYQFESSWDYDPAPGLGKIRAKLLALNFADDPINPVETGVMEPAIAKVANGRIVTVAAPADSFGHLNYLHPEIWKSHLAELLN